MLNNENDDDDNYTLIYFHLWMKFYGVTTEMKPLSQNFCNAFYFLRFCLREYEFL